MTTTARSATAGRPQPHQPPPTPRNLRERPTPPAFPTWAVKLTMSITGLVFVAFVTVHMIGNLKIYTGAEHFDAYAHWLRTILEPLFPYTGVLWILRVVLLICLVAHLACVAILVSRSRKAAGSGRHPRRTALAFGARSMLWSGIFLLAFIVVHILDLTVGTAPIATDQFASGAAYANLVASFSRPAMALFYILAMLALAVHVAHGLLLAIQDLGATGPTFRRVVEIIGRLLGIALLLGNASIPVLVLVGALA